MTPRMTMPNAFDDATAERLPPRLRRNVERRQSLLGPSYKLFYETPVEVVRAEGVRLFGADGEAYLDAYNNVPCVGHCHPHVVEAVARQASTLNTNTRYLTEVVLDYTERLLETHHAGLGHVMYACSGSEVNDLALRIARYATGREAVIVTGNAYHGLTAAIAEISPSLGDKVPLGDSVRTVPAPPLDASGSAQHAGETMAADVAAAIADIERHGMGLAAFVVDPLFSSDGMCPGPVGLLGPVADVVRDAGGLFIADEVQAGFGRGGETMWGYQRHGLEPDLVTMGKPMGNGIPIAGVAARPELLERFGADIRYFNTFGGNSVSIAAAAAVLDVFEAESVLENVQDVGHYFLTELSAVAEDHPALSNIRGAGLYLAADPVNPETGVSDPALAGAIVNGLRDRRVLISTAGPGGASLKVRPPLAFTREDAAELIGALRAVLRGL